MQPSLTVRSWMMWAGAFVRMEAGQLPKRPESEVSGKWADHREDRKTSPRGM